MNESNHENLFTAPIEVRWRDLDAFNHVNNSIYLTYVEQARLDWLQHLPGTWMDDQSAPVMAACQLNYRAPIHWPARVEVRLHCDRLGNSSMILGHHIVDAHPSGTVYCDGTVTLVWIDPSTGKSTPLPEAVRMAAKGTD
ncbi:thioesterase family protein [Oleiagrimonas sp.]|jgi:acyl-CoA thioester hydrolase|uniref:acyl-CoA thioesterase n=1 Tax=Oleiagrimonas sp. TaxID=2010330 RepID=UPI0026316076|nr:thioesterase family protein [Oleiagrimonas sp.]MDA3913082.1 thioesterase family protein [Oleiagrimonas sp.]